jgi:dephospho-CoA kinase
VAAAPTRVVVVEAIKLIEVGYHLDSDAVWVVTAPAAVRRARLMATRGLSGEDAQRRIDAQPPEADKLALADVVLVNDGEEAALARQVDAAWAAIPPA